MVQAWSVAYLSMPIKPPQENRACVERAESWMRTVQDQLKYAHPKAQRLEDPDPREAEQPGPTQEEVSTSRWWMGGEGKQEGRQEAGGGTGITHTHLIPTHQM